MRIITPRIRISNYIDRLVSWSKLSKNGIKLKMNPPNVPNMTQREKLEFINSEVRSFYEYCKEAGISDEDMDIICRPLTSAVRKASFKRWTRILLFLVMMIAIGFTVSQTDTFQWHASAVGRILLIKLLPFWDWTPLYYNKCLVDKHQPQKVDNGAFATGDCISCEAVKSLSRISNTGYNEVFNHNLLRGAPVVVTDANIDWAKVNITQLVAGDQRLGNSVPCRVLTNLRLGRQPMELDEMVTRITNTEIPSWFVHFQNCDIQAVKSFRVLAPRPYFLSPHIPPSHFNWLLISQRYDTHRFKALDLDPGLVIMSQLKGKNYVQLKPKSPCEEVCYTLNTELVEGEVLVVSTHLWDIDYLPGVGSNMALVTETDWLET